MKRQANTNLEKAIDAILALEAGKEIVVISGNEDYNSAIFWLYSEGPSSVPARFAWSKEIGECETAYNRVATTQHFKSILDGGGFLFARGYCE